MQDRPKEASRRLGALLHLPDEARFPGATDTPRKTNYDFERRERERSKAAEAAKKAQAKAEKKAAEQREPPT